MEEKISIFKRIPPGDRWVEIDGDQSVNYPSLTDALEYYFQKTLLKQFYIDAGAGLISVINTVEDVV